MKVLKAERYIDTNAYKLTVLTFERFFCIFMYCLSVLSLHVEPIDSIILVNDMHAQNECLNFWSSHKAVITP